MLINQNWLSQSWNAAVEVLSRSTSDHSPLLLRIISPASQVPRPFRFQHFWMLRSDFMSIVKHNWELPVDFYGPYKFAWKLKRLKIVLKQWNKNVVGNLFSNLKQAETDLQFQEAQFDASGSVADLVTLNECQAAYL